MLFKSKKGKFGFIFWIALSIALLLVILLITNKSAILQGKTFTLIKEKLLPFG